MSLRGYECTRLPLRPSRLNAISEIAGDLTGVRVADVIERVDLVRQRSPWFFDKTISQAERKLKSRSLLEVPEDQPILCSGLGLAPPADDSAKGILSDDRAHGQPLKMKHAGERRLLIWGRPRFELVVASRSTNRAAMQGG